MRLVSCLFLFSLFGGVALASPKAEIETRIRAFAKAGDARAVGQLEGMLHPQFRVAFSSPGKPGAALMDRATYLSLLKAGTIGGGHREVTIEWTQVDHDLAHAKVKMSRDTARFSGVLTFVRTNGNWQVLQDATLYNPGK